MRKNFSYTVMRRFLAGKGLGSAKRMIDSGGGPERRGGEHVLEREGEGLENWPGQNIEILEIDRKPSSSGHIL
jgi:hypothetical protein